MLTLSPAHLRAGACTVAVLTTLLVPRAVRGQQTSGRAARTTLPVATVRELHDVLLSPVSDLVFKGASEPPTDAAGWNALGTQSAILAESANLLMLGSRAKDQGRWMRMSRALLDAAVAAVAAARRHDAGALSKASDRIVLACERCHEPYRDGGRQQMR